MNVRSTLISAVLWTSFSPFAFTQDAKSPPATPDIQSRAIALMDRARQLSDIRAKDAPPFRLKAKFSVPGKDLSTQEGTYTETWVSESRWRIDIKVGDSRHTEVGGSAKRWLAFDDGFPKQADELPNAMLVIPQFWYDRDFQSITENRDKNIVADC